MGAQRLGIKYVEKPWGRDQLPPAFPDGQGRRIGELWFEGPQDEHPPLLVKYIFTSERLSIQVHPNDSEGRARGLPGGKTECWYIVEAEADARLGLGTQEPMSGEQLRAAALDRSLEDRMDWKRVAPGDFYYVPSGTVHAIGAGVGLIEVQQNVDVTYRLYDYGRPRALNLDDGVAVARAAPYDGKTLKLAETADAQLLRAGEAPFTLDLRSFEAGSDHPVGADGASTWFIPLNGSGTIDGQGWTVGECWLLDGVCVLDCSGEAKALLAGLR